MRISIILALAFALTGCIRIPTTASIENEKKLEEIRSYPGLKKEQIFKNALTWVATVYNSSNDVVQLKDIETGQIICKGLAGASFDFGLTRHFKYTMLIDIKDEKMRVRFQYIVAERIGNVAGPNPDYQWDVIERYLTEVKSALFGSITKSNQDSNW